MGNELWFQSVRAVFFTLILAFCLNGCGSPAGQNNVTWEFEGDDVRVIEKSVDGEGDRRSFFPAASIEEVRTSGHVVTVRSNGETFKVYCLDEKQARELAVVLENAMKRLRP